MLQNLQGIDFFAPTLNEIIINLFVSLFCSYLITLVYRITYKGPGYANTFVNSIVYLSLITTIVIMIIGNNLARAFGLVGALSIIRFRTAIKDTIDIVYIFFGLVIGMAAGVGYHKLAFAGTIIVAAVLMIFSKSNLAVFRGEQFLLQLQYTNEDVSPIKNIMEKYCSKYDLINVKSGGGDAPREFSYYINLKRKTDYLAFVDTLKALESVKYINLFRDEEHI